MRLTRCTLVCAVTAALIVAVAAKAEEPQQEQEAGVMFDPSQAYQVFFSLHPREIDRLSNVRLLGISRLAQRSFLRFEVLLNNRREEGWIDLALVSAILPTGRPLVTTPEVLLDRQPLDREKVKEVRAETVREVFREGPPPVIHR